MPLMQMACLSVGAAYSATTSSAAVTISLFVGGSSILTCRCRCRLVRSFILVLVSCGCRCVPANSCRPSRSKAESVVWPLGHHRLCHDGAAAILLHSQVELRAFLAVATEFRFQVQIRGATNSKDAFCMHNAFDALLVLEHGSVTADNFGETYVVLALSVCGSDELCRSSIGRIAGLAETADVFQSATNQRRILATDDPNISGTLAIPGLRERNVIASLWIGRPIHARCRACSVDCDRTILVCDVLENHALRLFSLGRFIDRRSINQLGCIIQIGSFIR
mmetsp:Transcript_28680/g.80830  ORF Transcript_28680/g.80830 Transcript_28680/m.80830 type:complete len:279 (+) Transcript_28680:82-918(+)